MLTEKQRELRRAAKRRWYHKHREERIRKNKEWKLAHPEWRKSYVLEYNHRPETKEIQRKSRKNRKPQLREIARQKYPVHRHKILARAAVVRALKNGQLIKPIECSICSARSFIHAHHADYSKQLDVVWVCASCHSKLHRGVL